MAWDCASAGNITEDDVRVGVTLGWEELNRGVLYDAVEQGNRIRETLLGGGRRPYV